MIVLILWLSGIAAFVLGTVILGAWLRRHPSRENAETSSRIIHFLFFAGLGAPGLAAFFYPGLTHLDALVGLSPLPLNIVFLIAGVVLALPGLLLMGSSLKLLRDLGSGANAFRLTKRIVEKDVYQYTRNPMSLGWYMCVLSISFIAGSTLLTLGSILILIPAHIFCLRFFEEFELELRFGEPYMQYRQKVPFLIPKFSAG